MRVKSCVQRHKRHNKVMAAAKGFIGNRSKHFRIANEAVNHALAHASRSRKELKRDMRKVWIGRINTFARYRLNTTYSQFIHIMPDIDRKILAELIYSEPEAVVEMYNIRVGKQNA